MPKNTGEMLRNRKISFLVLTVFTASIVSIGHSVAQNPFANLPSVLGTSPTMDQFEMFNIPVISSPSPSHSVGTMDEILLNAEQEDSVQDGGSQSSSSISINISGFHHGGPLDSIFDRFPQNAFLEDIITDVIFNEPAQMEFRTMDGSLNNDMHGDWGNANTQLMRLMSPVYGDRMSTPTGASRPSARMVSNAVSAQNTLIADARGLSDFVWQWGQFVDHDIDLTEGADPQESMDIPVPAGDPYFDPLSTGTKTIEFNRSVYDHDTGNHVATPRQQMNSITSFIDASNVYGSNDTRAAALRTFAGGMLKTSAGDLLPFNTAGLPNAGGSLSSLFLAGDVRANEQSGLTALHTLFVREHNRLAAEIASDNPDMSDEDIYQRARRIVGAQMQVITYKEFLPALLGRNLPTYRGYNQRINPSVANVFSTAAYRLGHSMLSPFLWRLEDDGSVSSQGHLALRDAFFNPSRITSEGGIDPLLRGLAAQTMQSVDPMVVDDVRNFLFGPPGSGGFDLAALNIQRGRDHGLSDFNEIRKKMHLIPAFSFSRITSDPDLAAALEELYGSIDNADVWVLLLAEDHAFGSSVGETVRAVLIDQFTRLRDGDRFWYKSVFHGDELAEIEGTTLADIIRRNTGVTSIQDNVFFAL